MHRQPRASKKTFAMPVAKVPERKPQIDPAQFANGPESAAALQNPVQQENALVTNLAKLQRAVGNRQTAKLVQKASGQPAKIQRLMATENYLYSYALPALQPLGGDGIWSSNDGDEIATVKAMVNEPFWNKLLAAVRIYDTYQRQKFVRANLATLRGLLVPILAHADSLDAWVYRKRRTLPAAISRMAVNLLDDAQQEQKALQTVATDNSIPDGAITFQQALFFARTGTNFSDVLTEGDLAQDPSGGEAGMPKNFSGGNVSTVTGLTYDTGGGQEQKVFKPNEQAPSVRDDGTNIDFLSAQTAIRAIATSRVQAVIKQKMEEAGREFKQVITSFDFAMYKGELGTSAGMAEGAEANAVMKDENGRMTGMMALNIDISDVEVQRQLANLQLFDMLTAQSDRNPGNIMIKQKPGEESKTQGIDQDFSFTDNNDITKTIGKTGMPALIDRYFAEAIMAIPESEFKAALKGLPKTSFDAALKRFTDIKKHLAEMAAANSLIVAPGDTNYPGARTWGDINPDEYRKSRWTAQVTDYAGAIRDNVREAFDACKADPKIQPKQIMKGGKQIWVIEYARGSLLRARNDDGSDLFDMVRKAAAQRRQETNFAYTGNPNRQRTGFQMGSRKHEKAK
jgi:hypothetical protein